MPTASRMMTSSNGNILRVTGTLWGNHRSPVHSPHKSQWCGALMFSFICTWTNGWANNRDDGDLRHHGAHYDVIVMGNVASRKFHTCYIYDMLQKTSRKDIITYNHLMYCLLQSSAPIVKGIRESPILWPKIVINDRPYSILCIFYQINL